MKHDCNQVTVHAISLVWWWNKLDNGTQSSSKSRLSPIQNGCDNFVTQDKEVAVEETDKEDKQSEQKKV